MMALSYMQYEDLRADVEGTTQQSTAQTGCSPLQRLTALHSVYDAVELALQPHACLAELHSMRQQAVCVYTSLLTAQV